MKQRILALDLIRVLACFMVVAMHSPIPSSSSNGIFLSTLSYISAPCIGLFFMVSGALLLPMKGDYSVFLKRRLMKVVCPVVFWSLVYIGFHLNKETNVSNVLRSVFSIPFSAQGTSVFWFMYTLIGLYLLVPILSPWIEKASKKEIEFYLILWFSSLCYPIIELFLNINESSTGVLYYFSGYVGYFILGFYLQKYALFSIKGAFLLFLISMIAPMLCKLFHYQVDFYRMFWYLSIWIAVQCIFWFSLFQTYAHRFFENIVLKK